MLDVAEGSALAQDLEEYLLQQVFRLGPMRHAMAQIAPQLRLVLVPRLLDAVHLAPASSTPGMV
jgi:hypothetical protein